MMLVLMIAVLVLTIVATGTATHSSLVRQSGSPTFPAPGTPVRSPSADADRAPLGRAPMAYEPGARTDAGPDRAPTATLGHQPTDGAAATSALEQRGAEALARISYPWQDRLPGWEITFHPAEDGAYGYTLTREHRIDIYVRSDQSDDLLAHVVAHEIGHAVDVMLNDGEDRRRWQRMRGIEDEPWWPDNRAPDFATGAGDFAESFAAWQVGSGAFRSTLGTPPSSEAKALLAELAEA